MAGDFTILLGTVGAGVWHSSNGGENWRRSRLSLPVSAQPGEIQIRALAASIRHPERVYAGSEVGLLRSDDRGASFEVVPSPMEGLQIWSVAVHPLDGDAILVGTKPPALFRTRNGGAHWEVLSIDIAKECAAGPPKVTSIAFDPRDPDTIWVSVEIDGVFVSRDGGESFRRTAPLGDDPFSQDVHSLALSVASHGPAHVVAGTPLGVFISRDEGESWRAHEFPRFFEGNPISYCRGVAVKADDPGVMFVGNGDNVPGKIGAIQRSSDGGLTWKPADLSVAPNSTVYWFGVHPAAPDRLVANSLFGYVYVSENGGLSWRKLDREFGETRAIAWLPH